MRPSVRLVALTAIVSILALVPSSPSVAVEFGDGCIPDNAETGEFTVTTLSAPWGSQLGAPIDGVVTKVHVGIPPLPRAIPMTIKTLRAAGPGLFFVTGEVDLALLGPTTIDTRLPVLAGDRLGLRGRALSYEGEAIPGISFSCEIKDGSRIGGTVGDVPPGVTGVFVDAGEGRIPVSATLEPDADRDGFGDETQDECPRSAALQIACPVVVVDSLTLARRRAAIVYVATSSVAPVRIVAVVPIGRGKKVRLKAGPKRVPPGRLVRFKLKYPVRLRKRLRRIPRKRKLAMRVTAIATDLAGVASRDRAKAKLKGRR